MGACRGGCLVSSLLPRLAIGWPRDSFFKGSSFCLSFSWPFGSLSRTASSVQVRKDRLVPPLLLASVKPLFLDRPCATYKLQTTPQVGSRLLGEAACSCCFHVAVARMARAVAAPCGLKKSPLQGGPRFSAREYSWLLHPDVECRNDAHRMLLARGTAAACYWNLALGG